ncbi:AAA family ATPase [Desulfovibrio intestinalis]|uniref:Pilus assembly protein CpaE n=1 Tax=Desulfovibrio intestinalis TaxID=58621 RepID=A0A7W8C0V2_9BACT|nr:hypothetical protein [Desulfovibrio intestinalis]MBB5142124.1 pilus assembly protein CpaE [Desulfovibrio intestinalis]
MSDSASLSSEGMNSNSVAVFCQPADVDSFTDTFNRLGRALSIIKAGGPHEATEWCGESTPPAAIFVNIDGTAHPVPALNDLAAVAGPGCRLVAMGSRQDVNLYRKLLQAGIFDYLLTPSSMGQVSEILSRADEDAWLGQPQAESVRLGQTVALIGAVGGVGASTVVTALGQHLAHACKIPTVLVDYDRRGSNLALSLGLEANSGLEGILSAPEVDLRLIQRTLLSQEVEVGKGQRLHLLAQRPGPESHVDPELVLQLGGALCQLFSMSVWDIPSHRPSGSDEILENADIRVVLVDYTLQNARAAHILLSDFGDESRGQRLFLVANAARHGDAPAISRSQFEDFLKRKVDVEIPYMGNALDKTLLQGSLNLASLAVFKSAVEKLACGILGWPVPLAAPRPGFFRRLLNR